MKIDWFDFRLVFSGILFFFIFIGLLLRMISWLNFRKELSFIKQNKIKNLLDIPTKLELDKDFSDLGGFREETDSLKKDVYFGVLDKDCGCEDLGLDRIFDGKILNLIKEKDFLLQQKDTIILSLEEKNKESLKKIIDKVFFLLQEKDKILKEKDYLILKLKEKIKESENIKLEKYFVTLEKPLNHGQVKKTNIIKNSNPNDIINVNFVSGK